MAGRLRKLGGRVVWPGGLKGLPELVMLGKDRLTKAAEQGLSPHRAGTLEICYIGDGIVWWWAEDELDEVKGGDLYLTWPGELHGGSHDVLNPCELYWLQVPLWKGGKSGARTFLSLPPAEAARLTKDLEGLPSRHFQGEASVPAAFERLLTALDGPAGPRRLLECRGALLDLLLGVLRCSRRASMKSSHSSVVAEALKLMDASLERPLALPALARRLGWSESHLKHRFRREVGVSPAEYHLRRRVLEAGRRLRQKGASVTQVALDLGFSSSQYFATAFKRVTGASPGSYAEWGRPRSL